MNPFNMFDLLKAFVTPGSRVFAQPWRVSRHANGRTRSGAEQHKRALPKSKAHHARFGRVEARGKNSQVNAAR